MRVAFTCTTLGVVGATSLACAGAASFSLRQKSLLTAR
jgi:hypothetical protein